MTVKDWFTVVISLLALAMSFASFRRSGRTFALDHARREEEKKRREWCERVRAELRQHARDRDHRVLVKDEGIPWVKWGIENGYFVDGGTRWDGTQMVQLPPDRPHSTRREDVEAAYNKVMKDQGKSDATEPAQPSPTPAESPKAWKIFLAMVKTWLPITIAVYGAVTSHRALSRAQDAQRPLFTLTATSQEEGPVLTMTLLFTNEGKVFADKIGMTQWVCPDVNTCILSPVKGRNDGLLEHSGAVAPGRKLTRQWPLVLKATLTVKQEDSKLKFTLDQPLSADAVVSEGQPQFTVIELLGIDVATKEPIHQVFLRQVRGVVKGKWDTALYGVTPSEEKSLWQAIGRGNDGPPAGLTY